MLTLEATGPLPTDRGLFAIHVFRHSDSGKNEIAITLGTYTTLPGVLVRLHSACLTSEVFHANNCECRQQLDAAYELILAAGSGIILYLDQDGRGNGLAAKVQTFQLILDGLDPNEAFDRRGFPHDIRDFTVAGYMLHLLGVRQPIHLLSNNSKKLQALRDCGIKIAATTEIKANATNDMIKRDLSSKCDRISPGTIKTIVNQ